MTAGLSDECAGKLRSRRVNRYLRSHLSRYFGINPMLYSTGLQYVPKQLVIYQNLLQGTYKLSFGPCDRYRLVTVGLRASINQ